VSTIIAAVRTTLACTAVSLYVLILGPPVLLWSIASRQPRLLYAVGAAGVRLGFLLAGLRLRVAGREHMPASGAVYACNHTSHTDGPSIFLALQPLFPRVRVLYKAELRKLPVLVWAFDVGGFVPVERDNQSQSRPAVERAAEAVKEGNAFFIFPEGTRSRTNALLPFKKGGFIMAITAQAPIVPVAIEGARSAMRKGSLLIWPTTIQVTFLPPVPTTGWTFEDRDKAIAIVRARLEEKLMPGRPDLPGDGVGAPVS
jgi:1-acyl-sn-glycerol-3-phosphate acyltransferase